VQEEEEWEEEDKMENLWFIQRKLKSHENDCNGKI